MVNEKVLLFERLSWLTVAPSLFRSFAPSPLLPFHFSLFTFHFSLFTYYFLLFTFFVLCVPLCLLRVTLCNLFPIPSERRLVHWRAFERGRVFIRFDYFYHNRPRHAVCPGWSRQFPFYFLLFTCLNYLR